MGVSGIEIKDLSVKGEKNLVKVEVKTQTTYVIDLPINSFSDICEDKMSIEKSNEMIIDFLSEKLGVGVDKIISVSDV